MIEKIKENTSTFNRLQQSAPEDTESANVRFLGDGLIASINVAPDGHLKLSVIDEKAVTPGSVSLSMFNADVDTETVRFDNGRPTNAINPVELPIDKLNDLADAFTIIDPAGHDEVYSWDVTRQNALSAPVTPGVATAAIRSLIIEVTQPQ